VLCLAFGMVCIGPARSAARRDSFGAAGSSMRLPRWLHGPTGVGRGLAYAHWRSASPLFSAALLSAYVARPSHRAGRCHPRRDRVFAAHPVWRFLFPRSSFSGWQRISLPRVLPTAGYLFTRRDRRKGPSPTCPTQSSCDLLAIAAVSALSSGRTRATLRRARRSVRFAPADGRGPAPECDAVRRVDHRAAFTPTAWRPTSIQHRWCGRRAAGCRG